MVDSVNYMLPLDARVAAVRRFNRFYTKEIGVLEDPYLHTSFSLAEARVLYEIGHLAQPTAVEVCKALALDAGYLSRILKRLEQGRLLARARSLSDGRQHILSLTPKGREQLAILDGRSQEEIRKKLGRLSTVEQERVVEALDTVSEALSAPPPRTAAYVLRPHQPGDMGWIVERHGVLYSQEHGWNSALESMTAKIVADFLKTYDPEREYCWIAEREGERLGSIFVVHKTDTVAKLRLLLVEPSARGLGLGKRLVDEAASFARRAGYAKIVLWTHSVLSTARHLYEQAGFRLVREKKHRNFGPELTGQIWELKL
jgi:DNA-binding MarR family transcriptional regulator/GNAT superfamily N-acetyltransferase